MGKFHEERKGCPQTEVKNEEKDELFESDDYDDDDVGA